MGDRIDQQPVVAKRIENRRRIGGAGGGESGYALFGAGELVVKELRQRVIDRIGARGAGAAEKKENGEEARKIHDQRLVVKNCCRRSPGPAS